MLFNLQLITFDLNHTPMKKNSILISLFLSASNFYAQNNTVSSGGNAQGFNGSVSYSIGQVFYMSTEGENGSINQGVQQPFDSEIITGIEHQEITLEIYPNPASNELRLNILEDNHAELRAELLDATGKIIQEKKSLNAKNIFAITDVSDGMYIVAIYKQNVLMKSYRIIKSK